MKVTVTKYLNVRVGEPSVNAPCYQYLAPGSEIEVDGQLYKGDPYDNIDTWYKDAAKNYYWSGGVAIDNAILRNASVTIPPFEVLVDYNKIINTNTKLPSVSGSGVNVALLDSGVKTSHSDLIGAVVQSQSFISKLSPTTDAWGHGTMMAGLIGGRASGSKGIRGVAPGCSIYNYRVLDDQGNTDMNALKSALIFIINNQVTLKINIINLSISVSDLPFVDAQLNSLSRLGVNIIVAGGNDKVYKYGVRLLAQNVNTFAVGVINDKDYLKNAGVIPQRLSCFYFNQPQYSCSSDDAKLYDEGTGDSIYTALTTGIVSLNIAAKSTNNLSAYCFNRSFFSPNEVSPFN